MKLSDLTQLKESILNTKSKDLVESSSYTCANCGERAEHEEIDENPDMKCSNCGDCEWELEEGNCKKKQMEENTQASYSHDAMQRKEEETTVDLTSFKKGMKVILATNKKEAVIISVDNEYQRIELFLLEDINNDSIEIVESIKTDYKMIMIDAQ